MRFPVRSTASLAVSLVLLTACGGTDSGLSAPATVVTTPGPAVAAVTSLSGSVAVGVAIAQGKLRVLDATGAVIAQDIAVGADGSYSIPTLTGTAPWRIEACGYVGSNFECFYSVAQATGTANVTPLTSATVLLAAGAQPGALMTGASTGLGAGALDNAQSQLRSSLGSIMSGNVASDFNFITGSLAAGSRSGYDRVLDAIGVSTGKDGNAFVQITPRLGSGNLYLEQGITNGAVTADAQAGALPLSQIDALFTRMTAKLASATACTGANGLAAEMASNARIDGDGGLVTGAQAVADQFCGYFDESGVWGATLLSPTLGRCVTTNGESRCRIGFDVKLPDGTVMPFASGMGVVLVGSAWKFMGSIDPVSVHMDARVQRQTRIDTPSVAPSYMRAIAIDVAHVPNLECATVAQRVSGGGTNVFAILKAFDSSANRLSIWRATAQGTEASIVPTTGFLRNSDDGWYTLPDGTAGDAVVRNFFRNGRGVVVSLFQDADCTSPLVVEGVSSIEVDIDGVPPVYASLPSFPWPELTEATVAAVTGATLEPNGSAELSLGWSYPNGRSGVNGVTFCGSLAQCGESDAGRHGSKNVSPSVMSTTLRITGNGQALGASRTLSLYGSGPGGIAMQSNFTACGGSTGYCQ